MKHFWREELACNCMCGQDTIDYELADLLDSIREYFGVPVTVTSGNRCPSYNAEIGGGLHSQHLLGKAADIKVKGVKPQDVADFAETLLDEGGIGRYNSFTHVDVRNRKARW